MSSTHGSSRGALSVFLAAVLSVLPAPSAIAQLEPGWHEEQTLRVGGRHRYFRYFVPHETGDGHPPMVIYLHGGGSSMRESMPPGNNGSAHWPTVAEDNGFILMVPNGYDAAQNDPAGDQQNWNDCRSDPGEAESRLDDVAFLSALIDWSAETLGVDTGRIYLSGTSNGGMMSYRMAQEAPQRIAAVAVFVANQPANSECMETSVPMPIMILNATADPLMPFEGGQVAGDRGAVLSAPETRDLWLRVNHLRSVEPYRIEFPDLDPLDGSVIEADIYAEDDREVRFYRAVGGGHAMPSVERHLRAWVELITGPQNHDLEGAEEAWAFMSAFHRPAPENHYSLSGLWYDPSLSGEGFNIVAGDANTVIFYFGSDVFGNRLWLMSDPFDTPLAIGTAINVRMMYATAGTFDEPGAPGEVLADWGNLEMRVRSCRRIDVTLIGNQAEFKASELVKLLGVAGAGC